MNSLSWMIYAADVCSNIGFPAALFSIIGVVAAIVSTIIKSGCADSESYDDKMAHRISASVQKAAIPIAIIALTMSVLVPTKDTVYAIAASETGEEILKTREATRARAALNAWLDKQIGGEKPSAEPEKAK